MHSRESEKLCDELLAMCAGKEKKLVLYALVEPTFKAIVQTADKHTQIEYNIEAIAKIWRANLRHIVDVH